jgi:hypothetical protein
MILARALVFNALAFVNWPAAKVGRGFGLAFLLDGLYGDVEISGQAGDLRLWQKGRVRHAQLTVCEDC